MNSIEIQVNGEKTHTASSTVNELLHELQLADKKVAVELNQAIVSRIAYESTHLTAGDELEIIHFVGGG